MFYRWISWFPPWHHSCKENNATSSLFAFSRHYLLLHPLGLYSAADFKGSQFHHQMSSLHKYQIARFCIVNGNEGEEAASRMQPNGLINKTMVSNADRHLDCRLCLSSLLAFPPRQQRGRRELKCLACSRSDEDHLHPFERWFPSKIVSPNARCLSREHIFPAC